MNLRELARTVVPRPVQQRLRTLRQRWSDARMDEDLRTEITVDVCGKSLRAPRSHILHYLDGSQAMRDQAIGTLARLLEDEAPDALVLDIGANIGDTSAHVAATSALRVVCVEPHPVFRSYLERNRSTIGNIDRIVDAVIGDGTPIRGSLVTTCGSSAHVSVDASARESVPTTRIEDLGLERVGLVKIDTDGFDFQILESNASWIAREQPILFFECEVRAGADERAAAAALRRLERMGYAAWGVFDDPGLPVLFCRELDSVTCLVRYLRFCGVMDRPERRLHNLDIVAFPRDCTAIYEQMRDHYLGPAALDAAPASAAAFA